MAHLNFFATRVDVLKLVALILERSDLRVLDMFADPDSTVREFRTSAEFKIGYACGTSGERFGERAYFTLWSPTILKRKPVLKYQVFDEDGKSAGFSREVKDESAFYLSIGTCRPEAVEMSHISFNSDGPEDGVRNWKNFRRVQRLIRKIVKSDLRVASAGYEATRADTSVMEDALELNASGQTKFLQFLASKFQFSVFAKNDA